MSLYKKQIGAEGEEAAARYLLQNKYTILERNYRCKLGEIDIIAKDRGDMVFIEVKTRSSMDYGLPCEAVNYRKQDKIKKVAQLYLMNKSIDMNVRFDIVEIIGRMADGKFSPKAVRVIKDAF